MPEKSGSKPVRPRKNRSLRRLVLALFAISLALSFALFELYGILVSSYYRGESSPVTKLFHPAPNAARGFHAIARAMQLLNSAQLAGPGRLTDPVFLSTLAADASPFGVALRIGDRIAFSSLPLDKDALEHFPAFGASVSEESFPEETTSPRVFFQVDFRTSAAEQATLFILNMPRAGGPHLPFARQISLIIALILLAADGAAGVYFILRLTGHLRRVEAAALAMSTGDLETPVVGGDQVLELARVFGALETMRSKIKELLQRERKNENERRELIANLSHDLRTPLSAIRGYVDGLREGIADTPAKRERYLNVLGQKIQDLDKMIGQIFLLSTLEAQASPPELRRIDLKAFLRDSAEELELAYGSDEAAFEEVGLDGSSLFVRADPLQLRRVVENLFENSIMYSGICPVALRLSLDSQDSTARIRVEDNGRGIVDEELDLAFQRFHRGSKARTGSGLGLGLAIAKQIVEAHGGHISASKGEDGGAAIVIELPLEGGPA
jgi:histidine kinase